MTNRRTFVLAGAAGAAMLPACASSPPALTEDAARAQVRDAELAFADTMARRNFVDFASRIAEDAVFVGGGRPLRGKSVILDHWSRYFKEAAAPFSWEPAMVEIASRNSLGYTEGPVKAGDAVVGRFFTTWQRQQDGRWLVVFDSGVAECKR